jgi:hypothetical protein
MGDRGGGRKNGGHEIANSSSTPASCDGKEKERRGMESEVMRGEGDIPLLSHKK